ncbi:MAG: polyphosphate:AMP phosphotransferase [Elusimicrobiota bacterium]|jgi:polyphosphate:AMP phosphotransferase
MFETAEVGNKTEKAEYKRQEPKLRTALLEAQRGLAGSDFSVVLLIGGVEGAGKTEFANQLLEWLDARGIAVHAWGEPTDEERERPFFWKFWRVLPAKRKAAFLMTSWYSEPIIDRVFKAASPAQFDQRLDQVIGFESMLAKEGVLLIKLWFHLSKAEQKRRFSELEKDPDTRWRVTKQDWKFHRRYDRFRKVCGHALMKTSTGEAPWYVVEAADRRYRNLTAGRLILDALQRKLKDQTARSPGSPDRSRPKPNNVIRRLDLRRSLDAAKFERRLEKLQGRLGALTRKLHKAGRSLTLVLEGPDAAGKGGAIRRLTGAMDARLYRVNSVAAPTDEEKARPYLWRFWRDLPRVGRVTIYDRSWYGRVLVERVEGFAGQEQWQRAYSEINSFESQLAEFGTIVLKFWIAISAAEQLRRFQDRQKTPYKQYKITDEDWRNRAQWGAYEAAACEMVERTSTEYAPWILVEGNDKRWARIQLLQSVTDALERSLR